MATQLEQANERISEFEEATVAAVALIDETESNRVSLQYTLDRVRETLADCYGDSLTDDVNEFLGIEVEQEVDELEIDEDE